LHTVQGCPFTTQLMLQPIIIILGTGLAVYACRSFDHLVWRFFAFVGVLAMGFEVGYFLSGGLVGFGVLGVLLLLCWPLFTSLYEVRRLRFQPQQTFRPRATPAEDEFPELAEMSEQIEAEGFRRSEQLGAEDGKNAVFVRVFLSEDNKLQAFLTLERHGEMELLSVTISMKSRSGQRLSTSLRNPTLLEDPNPDHFRNYVDGAHTFVHLLIDHEELFTTFSAPREDCQCLEEDDVAGFLAKEHSRRVSAAVSDGSLSPAGREELRLSWRGTMRLWPRVLRGIFG
jgi:hypothetical protein